MKVPSRGNPIVSSMRPEKGSEENTLEPVLRHRCRNEHDEGAGGNADLKAAAAKGQYDKAADDRCIESSIRRNARGDRSRLQERQRHDGNRRARNRIRLQTRQPVILPDHRDELWRVQLHETRFDRAAGHGYRFLAMSRRLVGQIKVRAAPN
jgi:hypothetical protein